MAIGNPAAVEKTLHKIIARTLHKEDVVIKPDTTFKQLGVDSMAVVQILVALEEALDIELEDEKLKSIVDMGSFIDYIQQKVDEKKISSPKKRGIEWRTKN
jgi:acyl carrier protein